MSTLHESILATMQSNGWPYAYACGYVHGREDRQRGRKAQLPTSATDDFALGYHKGYHS